MGPLTPIGDRAYQPFAILAFATCATYAQTAAPAHCQVSSVPTQVRAEGLTERLGDILLQCSGSPSSTSTGNLAVALPVSITNRVDSNNLAISDPVLSINYGMGFGPSGIAGLVNNQTITFNALTLSVPATGNFSLKISNLRAAVNQLGGANQQPVTAALSASSPNFLALDRSQVVAGFASTGLTASLYSAGIPCSGSPLPGAVTLSNLFSAGTALASTRLTEGFGSAFEPRAAGADTGTRFLVSYTGFPAGAQVYLPDLVAGSDAAVPTSGGDLGVPQAVGQYVPGSGTLLLARVQAADSNGAGGIPVPAPVGSGPVPLNSVSPVPLANGAGYAVYEVIDANPGITESVQFPTFVAITSNAAPALAQESVSLAPVSTVTVASTTAPIPRFAPAIPPSDCGSLGDCGAAYFPHLSVDTAPIQLTAVSGASRGSTAANIGVRNTGGGVITWSATADYASGSGWLQLNQSTSTGSGSVGVMANPRNLAPGAYQASIVINAGALGSQTIPVTLTVQPPSGATGGSTSPTGPVIDSVVNAATFTVTPLVPGSLATLFGSHFAGKVVSVSFNGSPAQVLYAGDTQINVQVPTALGTQGAATVVVTVDGSASSPQTVTLAPAWPAIFAHGVLNQDNTPNAASAPAKAGTVLQIFATGIPDNATVSAQIGVQMNLVPLYAGPAPGIPGVQQVNVAVPDGVAPGNTPLVICAAPNGRSACSAAYTISTE